MNPHSHDASTDQQMSLSGDDEQEGAMGVSTMIKALPVIDKYQHAESGYELRPVSARRHRPDRRSSEERRAPVEEDKQVGSIFKTEQEEQQHAHHDTTDEKKKTPTSDHGYEITPAAAESMDTESFRDSGLSVIEVAPGFHLPLRGARETQVAAESKFILTLSCIGCTLQVCCIRDAEYVLCPLCQSITPLDLAGALATNAFGVGLGFMDE